MKEYLEQINQDIKDIFEHNILTTKAYVVPSRNDSTLTFPIGSDKQGKLLETCVLMIDIRDSTNISRRLKNDKVKLGKIYSAFIYAMTNIADEYGYVRNIVGDRVMVVFEPKNCFVDAINCAAVMYTVATRILSKYSGLTDFKIGIGIDFGEMLVLKTGIQKKFHEQSEHKGLVWVGEVANIASKICDFANKSYSSTIVKLSHEDWEFTNKLVGYKSAPPATSFESFLDKPKLIPNYEMKVEHKIKEVSVNQSEFSKNIAMTADGWLYCGKKIISFSADNRAGITAPVLLSGNAFKGFKIAEPKSIYLEKLTEVNYPDKPSTGSGLYGGYLLVPEISNIKIV